MKKNIAKWFFQLFLSSLLLAMTWHYGQQLFRHGEVNTMRTCLLVASALGVVFGDLSLYKGQKVMGWAVVMLFSVAIVGGFLSSWWGIILQFYLGNMLNKMPWFVGAPFVFAPMIILSVIGYNIVASRERRLMHQIEKQQ